MTVEHATALLRDVPELGLHPAGSVRVPELRNVTFTRRTQRIVDHPAFQRLRRIRQLGPTHFVYPGATHTRFEHSLGVFSCVQLYVLNLLKTPAFAESISANDVCCLLTAGLLHDIGHYPFAHNLEALHLKGRDTPKHEDLGGEIIRGNVETLRGDQTIADLLTTEWGIDPERVISFCTGKFPAAGPTQIDSVLRSIVSSAIDADKMDYLERDSIHMGIPYGRNYDRDRLLASLTLNKAENRIAVTAKGKVSAEIFIFGRYTMFSEAYWHHTVRSASAMVEAALAAFYSRHGMGSDQMRDILLNYDDDAFLKWLHDDAPNSGTHYILQGMVGNRRRLYKRIATFSRVYKEKEKRAAYETIYELDSSRLYDLVDRLRSRFSAVVGRTLHPADLIIDTPPRDKDKLETVDVVYGSGSDRSDYPLHELSRIVAGVQDDFMMVVKKIRIFAEPSLAQALNAQKDLQSMILEEISRTK